MWKAKYFVFYLIVIVVICSVSAVAQEKIDNTIDLNKEGAKALDAGNLKLAISKFQEALKVDSSSGVTKENLAKAYETLGIVQRKKYKLDDAIESYNQAIAIMPTAHLYLLLGQAQQANKEPYAAIKNYQRAFKLSPDDKRVLDALVGGWEAALADNPISAQNHLGLGQALQYRGDFKSASFEYKQAIRFSLARKNLAEKLLKNLPKIEDTYASNGSKTVDK